MNGQTDRQQIWRVETPRDLSSPEKIEVDIRARHFSKAKAEETQNQAVTLNDNSS